MTAYPARDGSAGTRANGGAARSAARSASGRTPGRAPGRAPGRGPGGSAPSAPSAPPEITTGALWELAAEIGAVLRARSLTLAVAESLTGGWITAALTGIAGSSDYLLAGVTAYSNQAKVGLLGVNPETLAVLGAVSSRCAREMARGVRQRIGADLGLSATGIAGPGGGSPLKPVGLVYLSVADSDRFVTMERRLSGDRPAVTLGAAWEALALLRNFLNRQTAEPDGAP